MRNILILVLISLILILPSTTLALYQPWIAEQAARKTYNDKKATYSPTDQKKLNDLASQIAQINKIRTDELAVQMEAQGDILEEYQNRKNYKTNDQIDRAKYWVTYSHEAVAFQAAKNYIFSLSSEGNLKKDVTPTVNQFENDLSTLRKKVINSQVMVQDLVKGKP